MAKKDVKESKESKEKRGFQFLSYLPWIFLIVIIGIALYYPASGLGKCTTIAKVNGEAVCLEEIDRIYSYLSTEEKAVFTKAFILNSTINEKLLLQAATVEGIDFSDEEVEESVALYLEEIGLSKEKYAILLENRNLTYEQFLKDYKKQLVVSALITQKTMQIEVSDEEAQKYYDSHKSEFTVPEQAKVAHILLSSDEEAGDVLEQLEDGADFSELAKEKSIDPSAQSNGGVLEYATREIFVPEFSDYVFAMSEGDLGKVQTQFGFHVVKLIGKKPSSTASFEEAKKDVKGRILADKQQTLLGLYIGQLRQKAKIEIIGMN